MPELHTLPFIKTEEESLARRIELPNGKVICHCDGISRAVRACLQSSNAPTQNMTDYVKDRNAARAHWDYALTCAQQGNVRINELITEAEKEMGT